MPFMKYLHIFKDKTFSCKTRCQSYMTEHTKILIYSFHICVRGKGNIKGKRNRINIPKRKIISKEIGSRTIVIFTYLKNIITWFFCL